jgi:hypothetical protein
MTIRSDQGAQCYVMHCDTCPEHIETDHIDFRKALEYANEMGWRAYKGPDKLWAHACPSCTEIYAKEQR